jgi:hypothetical protein
MERDSAGEKTNIIAVLLAVSFQLGESDIVRIESHEPQMVICAGKHFNQTVFIVHRNDGYTDTIQIDAVLAVQRATLRGKCHETIRGFAGREFDHIDVGGWAFQTIELCHDEAADAVQPDGSVHGCVQRKEKRVPGLKRAFR